jgi:predicted DNA-binding protein
MEREEQKNAAQKIEPGTITFTLRLPKGLKNFLDDFAEKDRRTTTQLVRIILEDWVAEKKDIVRKRELAGKAEEKKEQ